MKDSTTRMVSTLTHQPKQKKGFLATITDSFPIKIAVPLTTSLALSYFGGPYVTVMSRESFPYAYGFMTGSIPNELGMIEYYGTYVPMREHIANIAYQNSNLICMTAGFAGYFAVKSIYNISSSISNSIYSLFTSVENVEEDVFYDSDLDNNLAIP